MALGLCRALHLCASELPPWEVSWVGTVLPVRAHVTEGAFFKVKDGLRGSWSTNSVPKSEVSCLPGHSKGTSSPRKPSPAFPIGNSPLDLSFLIREMDM